MAVLKAGAYGHGLSAVAQYLETLPNAERPEFLGVASVIEARELTAAGIKTRIYLLGPTSPNERAEVVQNRWTPCISSIEEARHFDQLNRGGGALPVHIAVDTGMGRGGFLPECLVSEFENLSAYQSLLLEGIGTHLPSADEDRAFTVEQIKNFDHLIDELGAERFKYRHVFNSAGLMAYSSQHANLCRPGLLLYGISPLKDQQSLLKPVMSLRSRVSLVRPLPSGHGISYGRDTVLEKATHVATIGVGYGDGFPKSASLKGVDAEIDNTPCPLLGRVTMDQIMVDVSHLPHCQSGDQVELFGEINTVSDLAGKAGLIPWEILTGITPRVVRNYIKD